MIPLDEAIHFLESILMMPLSWKHLLENDKLGFLSLYMRHHVSRIPFQNISMGVADPRHIPNEASIIKRGFSGQGGSCHDLSYFTKLILESLGFDSFIVPGTYIQAEVPNAHLMTIVRINENELYLLEVGIAVLEPIPLHQLPFKTQPSRGFQFEFREIQKGIFGRFAIGGTPFAGKFVEKSESLRTTWDLIPKNLVDFHESAIKVFTDPTISSLLRFPVLFRYFTSHEIDQFSYEFSEFSNETHENVRREEANLEIEKINDEHAPTNFIIVHKKTILIANSFTLRHRKCYESYKDMVRDLTKYFPMIDTKEIMLAMDVFSNYDS